MFTSPSEDILHTIGSTPVVAMRRITTPDQADIFAKYEVSNPSLSLKDRIATVLIHQLEERGLLASTDAILVAATAGNTGVALALVCAVKKIKLHLFMPRDASLERREMFASLGATLHLTDETQGVVGARKAAQDFMSVTPHAVCLDQFDDPKVAAAHEQSTAQEILSDFPQGVHAFVMGVGTGGTLTGVAQVLKSRFPKTLIVAVEPKASAVLSGGAAGHTKIQQLGLGFVPKNLRRDLIDRVITVTDADAYLMTQRLSRREGLLVGISSGANLCAALQIATELGAGQRVLTVLCDAGQRYFSLKRFFESH